MQYSHHIWVSFVQYHANKHAHGALAQCISMLVTGALPEVQIEKELADSRCGDQSWLVSE